MNNKGSRGQFLVDLALKGIRETSIVTDKGTEENTLNKEKSQTDGSVSNGSKCTEDQNESDIIVFLGLVGENGEVIPENIPDLSDLWQKPNNHSREVNRMDYPDYRPESSNSSNSDKGEDTDEKRCNLTTGRKPRGRKRKIENERREDKRRKRNRNESYHNYKHRYVESKVFADHDCHCPLQCNFKVSVDNRKEEFERFWNLGEYTAQNAFIASLVTEHPKKRQYGQDTTKRQFSRIYSLSSVRVCRDMFCKTLCVSPCRINTALKKAHGRLPLNDQRGLKQGGWNKISGDKEGKVVAHINAIPRYTSHYCRCVVSAEYLPPGMTLESMYAVYKSETDDPVSLATYKIIFCDKFNLKFKPLKKDTCNTCDKLHVQMQTNGPDRDRLKSDQEKHISLATDDQAKMKSDLLKASECTDTECLTFDMEKTLPMPRIPTNVMFYKRQLWLYNLCIHSGKTNKGYCYIWVEGQAGRGAQEVGSCLRRHITTSLAPEVENLILWSDSCGGQNRNIKIVLIMKEILHNHPKLKTVTFKYLILGHSYLPNDRQFSDREKALKHQQRLYTSDDYIQVMRTCRKKNPFMVTSMDNEDFIGTKKIEQNITNRKTAEDNRKINWLKVRQIKLNREEPFRLYMKTEFGSEDELVVNLKKTTRGRPKGEGLWELVPLWPNGKPITAAKLTDIESILHLIPPDAIDYFKNLKSSNGSSEEDIDGFSKSLDFDIEQSYGHEKNWLL